jgi:S-adenosylmethionine synthetase
MGILTDHKHSTTEAVLEGHPDKICDQIADAILDAFLEIDETSSLAVECLGTGNTLLLAGEVCSTAQVDIEAIARSVYRDIGYKDELMILGGLRPQSRQLRRPIESGTANDQTVAYGFACNTAFNLLPYGVHIASAIAKAIDNHRRRTLAHLPDGKVLVTVEDGNVDTIVLSVQHEQGADVEALRDIVLGHAVEQVVPRDKIRRLLFNHNSNFVSGGFGNDTGLTGRKAGCSRCHPFKSRVTELPAVVGATLLRAGSRNCRL